MNRAKKKLSAFDIVMIVVAILAIALIIAGACLLKSCLSRSRFDEEVVIGDFVCQEWGVNEIHIKDLSEEGKKKRNIIIPNELNGRKVVKLGYVAGFFAPNVGRMESLNLEKLYINCYEYFDFQNGYLSKSGCPSLKKIIITGSDDNQSRYFLYDVILVHYDCENNDELEQARCKSPNVVFYNNYKDAERDYHWIDDIDCGEKIEVMPPIPIRTGYKFGGWYKEQECINKWDFDNETIEDYNTKYNLYAKWIIN